MNHTGAFFLMNDRTVTAPGYKGLWWPATPSMCGYSRVNLERASSPGSVTLALLHQTCRLYMYLAVVADNIQLGIVMKILFWWPFWEKLTDSLGQKVSEQLSLCTVHRVYTYRSTHVCIDRPPASPNETPERRLHLTEDSHAESLKKFQGSYI